MWRGIAWGTFFVGVLDIVEVIVFYALYRDVKAIRILQSVAAGLVGRDTAYLGGMKTALLGLAIHFCIAFVTVTIYHLFAARIRALTKYPIVFGALYGLAVYAAMNFLILPITPGGPPRLSPWPVVANGLFAHLFCVGIPAAVTARYSSSSSPSTPALLYFLVLL
jgi:hypothetical protein